MEEKTLRRAFKETNEILKYISDDEKKKINASFWNFMKRNEDKNYEFKIDPKKDLEEYDLLHETKVLLVMIYKDYLCSQEEKVEIAKQIKENDKKYLEEMNRNIFKQPERKVEEPKIEEQIESQPIEEKEEHLATVNDESIFNKIIKFIKKLFKKG